MEALIDTNILVYRYDWRFPDKQRIAHDLLREGTEQLSVCLPHQAIVEFVAATTRVQASIDGRSLLSRGEAYREADSFLSMFVVLYPNEDVVATALRGAALYQLSWFDALVWAYAEVNGLPKLVSEDFEDGRLYGGVRVENPFLPAADFVNEPPAVYG